MSEVANSGDNAVITVELVKPGNNESSQHVQARFNCSKNLSAPRQFATIVLLILFSFSTLVALLKSIYEDNKLFKGIEPEDLLPSFNSLNYTMINDTIKVVSFPH